MIKNRPATSTAPYNCFDMQKNHEVGQAKEICNFQVSHWEQGFFGTTVLS